MRSNVRALLHALIATAAVAAGDVGHTQVAEPYPNRPVRIIVPFAAGGPGDLFARLLAQKLTENLGRSFYIDNPPRPGGTIATGVAAPPPAATLPRPRLRPPATPHD